MANRSRDPSRSYVRTVVPASVHTKAKQIARILNVTVDYLYTLILTRELYYVFPELYAKKLGEDLTYPESEDKPDA